MAYGKKRLVKGQNKDDQGEYAPAVKANQMNSEQKPGDVKMDTVSAQAHKETLRARRHLGIKRKK